MQTSNFPTFLNFLSIINPPNGVLLIGAGNGRGELVEWLIKNNIDSVTLVEPQDAAYKQLETHVFSMVSNECQKWTLLKEVVAEQSGVVDFYYTNKNTENGLTPPHQLNYIWPNLTLEHTETLSATSLTDLCTDTAQTHDWLIIDCVGALKVIGSPKNLASIDVAIIKVLFNTEDVANIGSDYISISEIFNAHGFDEKFKYTGIHPDIGCVVYVRNYQVQSNLFEQQLTALKTAHEQALAQHKSEQAAWQDQLHITEDISKQSASKIQQQQTQLEQLHVQINALTTTHEQTLAQHKSGQAAWQDQLHITEDISKQSASKIQQQQTQLEQLHVQINALTTTHEQALAQHKYEQAAWQEKQHLQTIETLNLNRLIQLNAQMAANKQIELRRLKLAQGQATTNDNHLCKPFVLEKLTDINLGNAWAGNTVNTVIFRHHAIFTHGEFQYTAFYVDETILRVVQRHLVNGEIKTSDLLGQYNLRDAHNSISLGMDRDGYLHLSFDHHATQLRYKRSLQPHCINEWSDDMPMTGQHESKVTYPTFILPRKGHPLTLLYRDGKHNKGCARIKTYDEKTTTWSDRPTPVLAGVEQKPWTSNAYWNHPAIASDGSLHISYVWRTGTVGMEQLVNNINIGYAWSPDNGYTWFTVSGQPYNLPITPAIAEVIWPISAGSNLINQCSMALDSNNLPHIVFYSNDENGIPQYQHLWFDGKVWQNTNISARTEAFNLAGGGTLQIPISRPEIVIDNHDNVYVIYRGDITQDLMAITCLKSPGYAYIAEDTKKITNESVGFSEPIIDRTRWEQESLLTMLLQYNEQPNHDVGHVHVEHPVQLIDIRF